MREIAVIFVSVLAASSLVQLGAALPRNIREGGNDKGTILYSFC